MQNQKTLLTVTTLLVAFLFSCSYTEETSKTIKADKITDTTNHGYNELADAEKKGTYTISDYNTDNPDRENIHRPVKSNLSTELDTALLFGIWTKDPDGPHADFVFSKKSFFIVDYDGDGDMPYKLNDRKLKIFYNDFVQEGEIISLSKDTLKVKWTDVDDITSYSRWRN